MSNFEKLIQGLQLLSGRLHIAGTPQYKLVVCGGTALIATELVQRATLDVYIVAMADGNDNLIDPAPLPAALVTVAQEVATDLGLPNDWLNNGPSSGDGGLFRLGLPPGLSERLVWKTYGPKLRIAFVSRYDQIHFKLYAAVDQFGSYHAADLKELNPTDEELLAAVSWSRSHDPSTGYLKCVQLFFKEFGYDHLIDRV